MEQATDHDGGESKHGGRRERAGRKRGSKTRVHPLIAARVRAKVQKLNRELGARQFAADVLAACEPEICANILKNGAPATQLEMLKLYKAYAQGPPIQRHSVETGPSALAIFAQILEERRNERRKELAAAPPAVEPDTETVTTTAVQRNTVP